MKHIPALSVVALIGALSSARADITPGDYYAVSPSYVDTTNPANNIVSYDWDSSGNLYYQSNTPSYNFGGFYEVPAGSITGSIPTAIPSTIAPASSDYTGASVVSIGGYVYYNSSDSNGDENIYKYGPTGGSPTLALTSTTTNYGLYGHNGDLFITGSPDFQYNHIYHSALNSDGSLASDPATDIGGTVAGNSGPLAFDSTGNLYYAAGYGDPSIYMWTKAAVNAALANPAANPLPTPTLVLNYSSLYPNAAGGTSLLVQNGQLFLTLTDFSGASDLASFGLDANGAYNGNATTILQANDTLGELRVDNGDLFVSDDNDIDEVLTVPEPSSLYLIGLGLFLFGFFPKRRFTLISPKVGGFIAISLWISVASVSAGPFSPASDQPGSTGISASDPNIVGWATGVVSYQVGPVDITDPTGAKANFGTPANTLGPSDATVSDPNPVFSLGDGGSITLSFSQPITDHPGADFAVFENGFPESGTPNAYFLELAYVAVSSDGVNFFTFPSVSLTQTSTQVAGFGTLDPTNIYNLAGKDIAGYGTPFNLGDLAGVSPLLNINDVTEVRVTDVIGNVDTSLGTGTYSYDDASNPIFNGAYGTTNNLINDPFKTDFNSGGFDLDAIAIVGAIPEPSAISLLIPGGIVLGGMKFLLRKRCALVA